MERIMGQLHMALTLPISLTWIPIEMEPTEVGERVDIPVAALPLALPIMAPALELASLALALPTMAHMTQTSPISSTLVSILTWTTEQTQLRLMELVLALVTALLTTDPTQQTSVIN
jgi:hypothetical protein